MITQTPNQQNNRRTSKKYRKVVEDEKPASVPRHIALKFMSVEGVKDVVPSLNVPEWLKIIVIPKREGYNHELHTQIIQVEWEISQALKPRNQKFEASISW